MWKRFERLEAQMLAKNSTQLSITGTGIWLRQHDLNGGHTILHAQKAGEGDIVLRAVTLFRFGPDDAINQRVDARLATLESGYWILQDATITDGGRTRDQRTEMRVPTNFTKAKLRERFGSPKTVSFWELPNFISLLEESGFPAHRHRMEFHRLLAQPVLLAAMVMIAATFSLRMERRGKALPMIVAGLAAGLVLFVVAQYLTKLGASSRIPVTLAAWAPATIATMTGCALVFHLEDG